MELIVLFLQLVSKSEIKILKTTAKHQKPVTNMPRKKYFCLFLFYKMLMNF